MKIRYELKKKWLSIWQKYKLKAHLKIASKLLLILLAVWLIGSVLTIFSQWACTDNFEGSPFQKEYLKYFWPVMVELVSGYDVGDMNLNLISDILAIVMVVVGLVIFAIFTGQIVSMFIQFLHRIHYLPEKPDSFPFNRPVIICGINNKLQEIIKELRKSPLTENREIVVVDESADQLKIEDKEFYHDVWYVKGNQADRNVLEKVLGEKETASIILAADINENTPGRYRDSRAIETALAIEGYREKTHTVLELIDDRNSPHLKHTKINEWISILDYGNRLVAQAALQHGMGNVFHHLLGIGKNKHKSNRLYFTAKKLPERLANRTYVDIRNDVLQSAVIDATLIGFARYVAGEIKPANETKYRQTHYIKQINPISRNCKSCGEEIRETDSLGRIQIVCRGCLQEKRTNPGRQERLWFFPKDTKLNSEDQLIYLSTEPVDFNRFF